MIKMKLDDDLDGFKNVNDKLNAKTRTLEDSVALNGE